MDYLLQHYGLALSILLVALLAMVQLQRSEDLQVHRKALALCLVAMAVAALGGLGLFRLTKNAVLTCSLTGVLELLLLRVLLKILDRAANDFLGGLIFDMVFSEGFFAEKIRVEPKLPNLRLLHHWRDNGEVKKAFKAARRALYHRSEALPVWLFAAETAAVHLQNLSAAVTIIHRLCKSRAFSQDAKLFAANHLKGLAAARGYEIAIQELLQASKQRPVLKPLKAVDELRKAGRFHEAQALLEELLRKDPENLTAHVLLVRVLAQDLHAPAQAEKLIRQLENQPFADRVVIDFLRASLPEWRAPRANPTPAPNPEPPKKSHKIVLSTPPALRPAPPIPRAELPQAEPTHPPRPIHTAGLSPDVADLVNEARLGTAVELLESRIRENPQDLDLRLELMQVQVINCGYLTSGERVLKAIYSDRKFSEAAKNQATDHFARLRQQYYEIHTLRPTTT